MIAFHGDPTIKQLYLDRVRQHRLADDIVHGIYWTGSRGCGVGCTIHSGDHQAYETELGIPRLLARLEDNIFEGLHAPHDTLWPEAFLDAIPVGADISIGRWWPQFALMLLCDTEYGAMRYIQDKKYAQPREEAEYVIAYYSEWLRTKHNPADAYAADAVYAADAAAFAAGAFAAAFAAGAAYACGGARKKARIWQSEVLLGLLRNL